ncbi:MAG: hypothetical protein ABIS45_17945 [Burkholderiales bacterium]
MSIPQLAGLFLLSMLLAANAFGEPVSDIDLKVALVGSWVNPPDSGANLLLPARQIFHVDGTTLVYIYATPECREPAAAIEGRWSVVNGVLITQVTRTSHPGLIAVGQIDTVNIVEVDPNRVVLDADDKLFVREKSDTCYPPDAHRT